MDAKKCSDALKGALRRRELKKLYSYNIYAIYFPKSKEREGIYYGPFASPNDVVALSSFKAASRSQPELQRKNLYCIGNYNSLTGIIRGCKPRLVVDKISNEENKE